MSADIEAATEQTVIVTRQKAEEARKTAEMERLLHLEAIARQTAQRQTALEKAMETLTKSEQRQVRLHAAILATQRGYQPGNKQEQWDDLALQLARYMADGTV